MLILQAIELPNIIRKILPDKQPAAHQQISVFEKVASVITSPALDETAKVNPNSVADNKQTDVGMVTRKRKKRTEKKHFIGSTKVGESTVSVPD